MGLIRKSVLQEIGGWSEWCITEDAEASLRVFKLGYKSLYYHHSHWARADALRLRRHEKTTLPLVFWQCPDPAQILGGADALGALDRPGQHTHPAQRYHYLAGCLQWFSDLFNFAFCASWWREGSIKAGVLAFHHPARYVPWIAMASIFIFLNLWRLVWVLRTQ